MNVRSFDLSHMVTLFQIRGLSKHAITSKRKKGEIVP